MQKSSLSEKAQFLALGFFMATTSFLAFNTMAADNWQNPTETAPGGNVQVPDTQILTALNRILGTPDNQALSETLSSQSGLTGQVSNADKVDGLHAADLQAADLQAATGGAGQFVALYSRSVLGLDWECLPYEAISKSNDDYSILGSGDGSEALIGGVYYSNGGGLDYVTSHKNRGVNFLCMKMFK